MSITAATVLTKAADLIEQQGWTQGAYYDGGCFCADGALQVASGYAFVDEERNDIDYDYDLPEDRSERDVYSKAYQAACKATAKTSYGSANIIGFNDDSYTTAPDVVAVLRSAVELVED